MLTIHRLWLGPDPMPMKYVLFGYEWAWLNPLWEVIDWMGWGIDAEPVADIKPLNYSRNVFDPAWLQNQKVWQELGNGAVAPVPMDKDVAIATQRADVAAYEIVYTLGG